MEVKINPDVVEFAKIIDYMFDLYAKKNANYGNSFTKLWQDLGPVSGLVPLHNKLYRLTNLVKGGRNDFESIEDSLIDLANYAIMNVIEMRRNQEGFGEGESIANNLKSRKKKQILNEEKEQINE